MKQLRDIKDNENYIFLAITETWLTDQIMDTEINLDGFIIHRQDRLERKHGGVALYVNETTVSKVVHGKSTKNCESLIVELSDLKVIIGVIYRPPNCPVHHFNDHLTDMGELIRYYDNKCEGWVSLIMGDIDFPFIKN